MSDIPRVALYLRLSDEDRDKLSPLDKSKSIENQRNMLMAYAKSEGWKVTHIYDDEDYSGADKSRPNFNEMIKACKRGEVDVVLVKTQSRFARDMETIEKYVYDKFKEWNIMFRAVVDRIDNTKHETKKTSQILGLTDEWYLEDTSLNIRETFKMKRMRGEFTGSFAPYGYMKDSKCKNKLVVDANVAKNVKRIFNLYKAGVGPEKIASILNNEGVLSPYEYKLSQGSKLKIPILRKSITDYIVKSGIYEIQVELLDSNVKEVTVSLVCYDSDCKIPVFLKSNENNLLVYEAVLKENRDRNLYYVQVRPESIQCNTLIRRVYRWSSNTIKKILKDEVYIGNMVQFKTTTVSYKNHTKIYNSKDDRIKVEGTHESIIDEGLFWEVNNKISKHSKVLSSGEKHILAGLVYCKCCGNVFYRCGKKDKFGFGYLCCKDKLNKWANCNNTKYLKENVLHEIILNELKKIVDKYYDINMLKMVHKSRINDDDVGKDITKCLENKSIILEKLEKSKNVFQELYEDRKQGLIDNEEYMFLKDKYKCDREKMKEELKRIDNDMFYVKSELSKREDIDNLFRKYRNMKELNRLFILKFIERIDIGRFDNETNERIIWITWK